MVVVTASGSVASGVMSVASDTFPSLSLTVYFHVTFPSLPWERVKV